MNKLVVFLILIFSALNSCKSQNIINSKENVGITKNSDTISCPFVNNYYFNYIKVSSRINRVENKVNSFLLTNGEVLSDKNNFDFLLKKAKDSIKKICEKEEQIELFEHYYEINYNNNFLLSLTHNWLAYGYVVSNIDYYNFNLENGDLINIDDIISLDRKKTLFNKVQNKVKYSLKNELEDYQKNESKEFYNNFKENIISYKIEYKIEDLNSFIFVINEKEKGIEFKFSYEYPQAIRAFEPVFQLFFSFEELKPFLKEDFKKQIGIK